MSDTVYIPLRLAKLWFLIGNHKRYNFIVTIVLIVVQSFAFSSGRADVNYCLMDPDT